MNVIINNQSSEKRMEKQLGDWKDKNDIIFITRLQRFYHFCGPRNDS